MTATGLLWVVSSDFARNLSEVSISSLAGGGTDTGGAGHPDAVEWCGDNAVALVWGGKVVIAGPGGESLR